MIKFKPIVYNSDDFRAYRFSTAASSAREGLFCVIAASTTRAKIVATPFTAIATYDVASGSGTTSIADRGDVFVIWRENLDIENVGATINAGDEIIGMPLRRGNEFEIHNSVIYNSDLALFTAVGQNIYLNTNGKLCAAGATNQSKLLVAECLGTFNSVWLRARIK